MNRTHFPGFPGFSNLSGRWSQEGEASWPSNVGSFRVGEDFLQKDMFPTINSEFTSLPLENGALEDYILSFSSCFGLFWGGKLAV